MPFLLYLLTFFFLGVLSWLAFSLAASNISLIYQPLLSFTQAIKLGADSEFISSSPDLLSIPDFTISSSVFFIEECVTFCVILALGILFYKILDTRQWFILRKEPSFNFSVSKFIKIFEKIFSFLKRKKKPSNFFIPRSIFALNFSQITFLALLVSGIAALLLPQDSAWLYNFLERVPSEGIWLKFFIYKFIIWLAFAALLSLLCKILCDDEITELFFEDKFSSLAEELAFKKIVYSLVALNPFLIIEILWNGHCEIFLAFGLLATVYYVFKKKVFHSIVLGLGALVIYLLLSWNSLSELLVPQNSFYNLLNSINNYIGAEDLPYNFSYVFLGLFGLFFLWVLYRFLLNKESESLFYYSFLIAFVFFMIVIPGFQSWYLVVLIPLGALLHPRLIFILSLTHLLSVTFLNDINVLNHFLMTVIPTAFYLKYLLRYRGQMY